MGPLLLLALLSGAIVIGAVDGNTEAGDVDDDTPSTPPLQPEPAPDNDPEVNPDTPSADPEQPDPPDPDPDAAQRIDYPANDGPETIQTGAGDDTIFAENDGRAFGVLSSVDTGAGNDSIILHGLFQANVEGGAGDDTIVADGPYTTVSGGDGNDSITGFIEDSFQLGIGTSFINGDDGDDVLEARWITDFSGFGEINGGMGDDTLRVYSDIGIYESNDAVTDVEGSALAIGGEGADVFELYFDPRDGVATAERSGHGIEVGDFESGVDIIVLDADEGYDFKEVTITGGGGVSFVLSDQSGGPDIPVELGVIGDAVQVGDVALARGNLADVLITEMSG